MNTSTTWTNTVWYTITKNASNTIEIDWQAATTPSGNNGSLTFWVNGVQRDNKTGLRNGNRAVDTVQWGMVTGRDTGTSGAFYLDGFVSRRATYIGSQSTGQMAVGPVFDLAAKSYHRPVRLDGLKDRAAAGLAAPLADISGTVLVTTTIGYQYDGLGRLIAARYSDGRFFEYTYDSTGNRLSETKPTGSLTYTYDVANRLLTAGAQAYVWDAAGNLITDGAITYTYDSAQRLIGLDSPGSTSSYVYNGLGDRVQQSVNGATTNYALDLNTGLTQVLADNGTVYLYGADRLGERQAGGWQYHHADGLGSLRALTNGSATVTLSKRYAPYGDVLDTAGTGASVFGFTGEQQDSDLIYLRARYYQSSSARFVSRDLWSGNQSWPMGYNHWVYAGNDPVNSVDPSGLVPCAEDQSAGICVLNGGGFLDMRHYRFGRDAAQALLTTLLPANYGKRIARLGDYWQPFMGQEWHWPAFYTDLPAEGLSTSKLSGVALGIFLSAQMDYERDQGLDPWCYSNASNYRHNQQWRDFMTNHIQSRISELGPDHHCSSFSNEDLPSDYLGFVMYSKSLTFQGVMKALGGGEQLDSLEPPPGYRPPLAEPSADPLKCALGYCPSTTPFNNQCSLKVLNEKTGEFVNKPWPTSLQLDPYGFGKYWARNMSNFAVPVPTPGSPNRPPSQTTPRPPGAQ